MSRPRKAGSQYGNLGSLGEDAALIYRHGDNFSGKPWVIALHGQGANPTLYLPAQPFYGDDTSAWAESGMVVLAPDAAGSTSWGNNASLSALDNLYTWATGTLGLASTCAVHGVSMGGIVGLNWIRRNTSKVRAAAFRAPVTDLDFFHDNATYTAEIDAAYGGNYAANSPGHNPIDDFALYQGLGIPIKIFQGDSDPTVPLSQSQNFVAAVNDPNITLTVIVGGVHNLGNVISSTTTTQLLAV